MFIYLQIVSSLSKVFEIYLLFFLKLKTLSKAPLQHFHRSSLFILQEKINKIIKILEKRSHLSVSKVFFTYIFILKIKVGFISSPYKQSVYSSKWYFFALFKNSLLLITIILFSAFPFCWLFPIYYDLSLIKIEKFN